MSTRYDLTDLTLVVATPAQVRQTRVNTFAFWGAPRGFDEAGYLRRDELLEREAWAREGRLTTWLLVPRSTVDPATAVSSATVDEILSHVETYRRPAFSFAPASAAPLPAVAFGIASVYTPEQFRKKGYGRRMLQLLHYVLAPASSLPPFPNAFGPSPPLLPSDHVARDGLFSVLYSDVGEAFYRGCSIGESQPGWVEQGSVGHEWALPTTGGEKADDGWAWLESADDVKALEGALATSFLARVASGEVGDAARARVGFSSAQDLLPLHVHRALLSPPFPASQPPTKATSFGFLSSATSSALFYYPSGEAPPYKGSWPSPPDKTLLITALIGSVPWSVVVAAAAREGCKRVEVWGEEPVDPSWPAGKAFTRDEHLSQLAYYPSGAAADAPPPQLVFNQKYAWC